MIGAIIGDIVGSRFEFNNHRSTEFEFFHPNCDFTDDTVMTVAVADAIMSGRPFGETMHEYGNRYVNRGYGGRFFQWLNADDYRPYNSFGNGSAMRVSPCAFLAKGNREKALTWASASAVCTHNHLEGVKGALAITDLILMASERRSKDEIRKMAEENQDKSFAEVEEDYEARVAAFADQAETTKAMQALLQIERTRKNATKKRRMEMQADALKEEYSKLGFTYNPETGRLARNTDATTRKEQE